MIARYLPAVAVSLAAAASAGAQGIPRDQYFTHLPPMPKIVAQTNASRVFELYGSEADPAYRDESPRDGIDDRTAARLLRLAVRFAPVLRRNNFSRPVDYRTALGGRPVLHVDSWSSAHGLVSDSALLYDAATPDSLTTSEPVLREAMLERLIREFHPEGHDGRIVRPDYHEETVLFFDFPGHNEKTWRAAYRENRESRIYAHFFIHEDPTIDGPERYTLAIQYWLFYPFNDGANNHEGDWEHLVVLITTAGNAAGEGTGRARLTKEDLRRILDPEDHGFVDYLTISAVEYYFHESVATLDYVGAVRAERVRGWHVWQQPHYVDESIRRRLEAYGGALATHPIGYIGGNNKGPDELANLWPRFSASYNRNGHGTYPFGGRWLGVGRFGATEQLSGAVVPRLRPGVADPNPGESLKGLFEDDHFMSYDAEDIILLPDWERVKNLVLEDAAARREWAWLLLPIRWGFPVSPSPGGGLIEHTDLGQISPEGPAFQPTWNRLAAETGFRMYDLHVLRSITPVTPYDRLISGWGFLNVPVTLLGFLPGWNVAVTQLGPWLDTPLEALGAPPARTFSTQRRTRRFTSSGVGPIGDYSGRGFARFAAPPENTSDGLSGTARQVDQTSFARTGSQGTHVWLNLHYGPRFTLRNGYTRSTSQISYDYVTGPGPVKGTLALRELTGGFRYAFARTRNEAIQVFGGGGWGWTWYDVRVRDDSVDTRKSGGYAVTLLPSTKWWPNTWYGEAGVEVMMPRKAWVYDRIGYGAEMSYSGMVHRLGAMSPDAPAATGVTRRQLSVGLVVSW